MRVDHRDVSIPLTGGIGLLAFNRICAWGNDNRSAGAMPRHGVVGRLAVIGTIGRELPDRYVDRVKQRLHLRGVAGVLVRHDMSDDVAAGGIQRQVQRSRVRIFAENSPFDMKDHLKARGYRWSDGSDGRPKSWWVELAEEVLDDELHYLRSEIYRWPDADPPIRRLTAYDRFKA